MAELRHSLNMEYGQHAGMRNPLELLAAGPDYSSSLQWMVASASSGGGFGWNGANLRVRLPELVRRSVEWNS